VHSLDDRNFKAKENRGFSNRINVQHTWSCSYSPSRVLIAFCQLNYGHRPTASDVGVANVELNFYISVDRFRLNFFDAALLKIQYVPTSTFLLTLQV